MLVSSDAFGDAVREVYEPEWPGRDKLIQYLEVCDQVVVISQGLWAFIVSCRSYIVIIIVHLYFN